MQLDKKELARYIDHTYLRPEGRESAIRKLCREARDYGFAAVAIGPYYIPLAAEELRGTDIDLSAAVGFPLGYTTTATKAFEAEEALQQGATEIDMVANITAVKSGFWSEVKKDIQATAEVCGKETICKVIFETCYLKRGEMERLAEICLEIEEVDFLKTSTGFGPEGARAEDVRLLGELTEGRKKIKASGGIRTLEDCEEMIEAGAERLGTSAGVALMEL